MLHVQVKFDFRLIFFNLSWFSISFVLPLSSFARIIVHLESYIKNSTWEVFHLYPDASKLVSKNTAAPHISAHFSVSGYRMKHCVSFFMYYVEYLSFSSLIHQLHSFQVNPNIKFEVFIHKVDGLSDDHKIGGFNLALIHVVANWLHVGSQTYYFCLWILYSKLKIPFLKWKRNYYIEHIDLKKKLSQLFLKEMYENSR